MTDREPEISQNLIASTRRLPRAAFDLFLVSALGLFVELVFIRWLASELRLFAFYKNFALIAAFLGLGLGFALHRRADQRAWFERYYFPMLAVSVVAVLVLGRTPLSEAILLNRINAQEFVWAGVADFDAPVIIAMLEVAFYAVLLSLVTLIAVLFIPLGMLTARKFAAFAPLPAYTLNVAGSLSGILLYTFISFLGLPPPVWFLLAGVAAFYFLPAASPRLLAANGLLAALPIALTLLWPSAYARTVWSPYYRIDVQPLSADADPGVQLGYELSVNQAWHQRLWNLAPEFVQANYEAAPDHFDSARTEYDAPYRAAPSLEQVLIVGAGTGNDVAGALRAGAGQVTAVEIDPRILQLGQELHPERPYADPQRVRQVNEDARSFFQRDTRRYDLIVFGLLDSHTLLSMGSSVRLDNFVYTHESIAAARNLLNTNGLLALSFGVPPDNEWVGWKLYRTLTDVFGHEPQVYSFPNNNTLFLIAREPLAEPLLNQPLVTPRTDYAYHAELPRTTDDWPYLYLRQAAVPVNYLIALAGVAVVSLILVPRALPDMIQIGPTFFFFFSMGAAFFLLETKSLTEMALLFGSTWLVNAVVIAGILAMIVGANLVVDGRQLTDARPAYALLALSLVFNFFAPPSRFLGFAPMVREALATLAQVLPLFFAGLIFAITFRQTKSVEVALGANLLGAVLGGMCEYASLIWGLRSLSLLALAFYALSAVLLFGPRRQ